MKVLELCDVKTDINNQILLDGISFSIEQGKVMALLGHNGAGKSTLMKTIMHVLEKQTGTITIEEQYDQDEDLLTFKKRLAYLPEEPLLLPELTVMQHFQLYGISYDIPENDFQNSLEPLVQQFDLESKLHVYPEELSKGMRQKVQTICSMLPDVPLLLIDEPFMGLDVYAIQYLLTLLQAKVQNGKSILLTTHQLDQAKDLADDFILLEHGTIKEQGSISTFETITRGHGHD